MTATIFLDPMDLDGKVTPVAIVDEIMRQNPDMPFPVPLEHLASIAGIQKIDELVTEGFEGMLMTDAEKFKGVILVKANANPQRRRFTIGHELGHFLLPWHRQLQFSCTAEGIQDISCAPKTTRGQTMEQEANAFASELLMPTVTFKKLQRSFGEPDIKQVQSLADYFDTSIEATARRFMNLSDYAVAFVFSHKDSIRYWTRGPEFPYVLRVRNGSLLPKDSLARNSGDGTGSMEELDSLTWLDGDRRQRLPDTILEQTLFQQDGYKVTLLYIDNIPDEDEDSE